MCAELKQNAIEWRKTEKCYEAELPLNLPPEAAFMYRSSNNMVPILSGSSVFYPAGFEGDYPSQDVIIVGDDNTNDYILAGAVTAFRSMSWFCLRKNGYLFHSIVVRQPDIAPDEQPEELVVWHGNNWQDMLIQYAELTAKKMGVKKITPTKNLTGYCTWYYYYANVSEADFFENLTALKKARKNTAFSPEVVQIDDGYQPFQGDWLKQNSRWKTPMEEIASQIRKDGMTAGIWLMPFVASGASEVYTKRPEWFVKNEQGIPCAMPGWSPAPDHLWYCLDTTIPAVRKHLVKVFQTLRQWGFQYFKLDGLGFGLQAGIRQDKNATPVSAYRLGMQTIREAVPECIILGCCPPFLPSLGTIDNCRISPDTSRYWIHPNSQCSCDSAPGAVSIVNAMHGIMSNWWMFDRFFRADPDTLMARADNVFYTLGEARISVIGGILTGICITSDHFGTISQERMALLDRAAKYRMKDARPLKWSPDNWPQVFIGTINGKKAAAVINATPVSQTYVLEETGLNGKVTELLHPFGICAKTFTLHSHDAALFQEE